MRRRALHAPGFRERHGDALRLTIVLTADLEDLTYRLPARDWSGLDLFDPTGITPPVASCCTGRAVVGSETAIVTSDRRVGIVLCSNSPSPPSAPVLAWSGAPLRTPWRGPTARAGSGPR